MLNNNSGESDINYKYLQIYIHRLNLLIDEFNIYGLNTVQKSQQ